jgi:hypothetical protein
VIPWVVVAKVSIAAVNPIVSAIGCIVISSWVIFVETSSRLAVSDLFSMEALREIR